MVQFLNDWGSLIAILLSPLLAWIVTIWYQNRAEKRKAKRDLFLILMAKRRTNPPPIEYVDALNKIDVVFQNNKKVRLAWKGYFDALHPKSQHFPNSNSYKLDLLSEMASVLGYKNLKQTEIDRFYSPQYFEDTHKIQQVFWKEHIRFLQYSKNVVESYSLEEMKKRYPPDGIPPNEREDE